MYSYSSDAYFHCNSNNLFSFYFNVLDCYSEVVYHPHSFKTLSLYPCIFLSTKICEVSERFPAYVFQFYHFRTRILYRGNPNSMLILTGGLLYYLAFHSIYQSRFYIFNIFHSKRKSSLCTSESVCRMSARSPRKDAVRWYVF